MAVALEGLVRRGGRAALWAVAGLSGCATEDLPAPYDLGPAFIIGEACLVRDERGLVWPIACSPGEECWRHIVYPDLDGDGLAADCSDVDNVGHAGTDLGITVSAMMEGVEVLAAADAEVLFVFDDKHDRCDVDDDHPDCQEPAEDWREPGQTNGHRVCTERSAEYCNEGSESEPCFRCFDAGNLVLLRHLDEGPLFVTAYAHIRKDSALVTKGDVVEAGTPIALVGSSGQSTAPHLHFEIWRDGTFFLRADPWSGPCPTEGQEAYLFASDPPWCF